jgi:nitrogen PTS system EIIA component
MALIDLIEPDVVKIPMESTTKYDVMRELATLLETAGRVPDREPVIDALMERESKGSTGLEMGIAVPHCKTTKVDGLVLAIGIAPDGIEFESLDGKPAQLFFMMLAPPDQSGPHIEALSEIARLTQSASFCRALLSSTTPEEVVELFGED